MTSKLTGKRKEVFNSGVFFNSARSAENNNKLSDEIAINQLDAQYFNTPVDPTQPEKNTDKARIAVGLNFDYVDGQLVKTREPAQLFSNSQINVDFCDPPGIEEHGEVSTRELVVFVAETQDTEKNFQHSFNNWLAYVKAGVDVAGTQSEPLIKPEVEFYDLYYESASPFTPQEIMSKQPVGKAFYADFETYYNEAVDSKQYEDTLSSRPDMNNSLPSLYGFVRFLNNEVLEGGDFAMLNNLIDEIDNWYTGDGTTLTQTRSDVYTELFNKYPLETLITLYGFLTRWKVDQNTGEATFTSINENQILQRILNFDSQNINKNALFEDYIDAYANVLSFKATPLQPDTTPLSNDLLNRITALERALTRVAFSPNFVKIADKINKYKDNFPYYFRLEFTAELNTSIGDLLRDYLLTRFFSRVMLLKSFTPYDDALAASDPLYAQERLVYGTPQIGGSFITPWDKQQINFYDYYSENTFVDLASAEIQSSANTLLPAQPRASADMLSLLNTLAGDPISEHLTIDELTFFSAASDIRNNMVFIRDDFNDPINLNEDKNIIYQKLVGAALKVQVLQKYKEVRRTYEDIVTGKPAYTEDLFYKIVKYKKQGNNFVPLQYILIPNTSDLDIAEYVDTQLKYSKTDDDVYKYEVYAQRIVFGSTYKYFWTQEDNSTDPVANQQYEKLLAQPVEDPKLSAASLEAFYDNNGLAGINGQAKNEGYQFSAKVVVQVDPLIKIVEDKIITTPDIMIMDVPPVPPSVDIVPYYAVNNRLKFLLFGSSDRYRQLPVSILDSDTAAFEKILAAQVSPDGLVEFGSDDPVQRFQIFRIKNRPTSYADFDLYNTFDGNVFEEKILPNTKYYYTFRAVDIRGNISNPSPVYEVELIDEKGAVKPLIRVIDIEPKVPQKKFREVQKYLYIKPSLQQLYSTSADNIDSAFSDETTKKKYKIRLTSKSSGKKIDLNLSFQKKQETNS